MIQWCEKEDCPICLWPMHVDPMWRYMGAACVSLHSGKNTSQHRHDLHFDCCINVFRRAQQQNQQVKCPVCNKIIILKDLKCLIEKILYRYSIKDRKKLFETIQLPKKHYESQEELMRDLAIVIVDSQHLTT
jgi:hypothetical protein